MNCPQSRTHAKTYAQIEVETQSLNTSLRHKLLTRVCLWVDTSMHNMTQNSADNFQGRSQDFTLGGGHWSRGAETLEPRRVAIRRGCPPPQPTMGSGERRELPQQGLGRTHFWHTSIWGPQNTSGRENSTNKAVFFL